MLETLVIQSHKGPYQVLFDDDLIKRGDFKLTGESHFLVDANVARLYAKELEEILKCPRTLVIEATEENKSIERVIDVIRQLVDHQIRRNHLLVAVGGGIIQDIACFIASTLLRGLKWRYIPTTLLAQADSCIGSKSSINLGTSKNILGTFNPPSQIVVCTSFLDTLEKKEIHSGLGEVIKVHVIDGVDAFNRLAGDFAVLLKDRSLFEHYINRALLIKKRYIEQDEFDAGIRNIFNYGHSFGHAIESATCFGVPHGVAVTMGMEIANYVSWQRKSLSREDYLRMRPLLIRNCAEYARTDFSVDSMLSALSKDKKNTSNKLVLILPVGDSVCPTRVEVLNDDVFRRQCKSALSGLRT